eukprot:TRINITY_DN781_c0_g2_i1.p1 TRINITY_DN781_c0_g2~~TRINITY_DN781_c0_g2_i1.p1  ORF type:complete len:488 (+),score=127.31 TRINITY_DN781_c0_g2_i1:62-1525(+)
MAFYSVGPDVSWWKWLVLLAFAINTFCNSFMFMDFSTVGDVSKETFGWVDEFGRPKDDSVTDSKLNWLYSASLLSVLPMAFPAARLLTTHQWYTMLAMTVCNCLGAWLRYLSVRQKSYGIAVVSSVPIGFAAAVLITACAYVPSLWFPKESRSMATSFAVMANYAGWALSTALIPALVKDSGPLGSGSDAAGGIRDLEWMLLVQACIVSAGPIAFLLFHRERPARNPNGDDDDHDDVDEPVDDDIMKVPGDAVVNHHQPQKTSRFSGSADCSNCSCSCSISVPYIIQGMAHSVLGGISFTIPAVQTTLFSDLDFSDSKSSWTNFAFVTSGVVAGLVAGKIGSHFEALQESIMTALYLVCAIALTVVTVVAYNQDSIGKDNAYPVYIVFMGFAGAGSLGFIGVALTHACRHVPGVPHSYSAGAIEWFIQVWGAVLAQVCVTGKSSFVVLTAVTWATTLVAITALRVQKGALQAVEKLTRSSPLIAPEG